MNFNFIFKNYRGVIKVSYKISIFLSLSRQLVYLLPGLLLLPPLYGVKGVWISMPVSDGLAFVTAVVILMVYIKKVKEKTSGQKL